MKSLHAIAAVVSLMAFHGVAQAADSTAAAKALATSTIHLEQNATDGDYEIVVEALCEEGLATLVVKAPDGKTIIDYKSAPGTVLGMRQFRFETPEPEDLAALTAVYPAGVYTFEATTGAGATQSGKATLSHTMPAKSSVLDPAGSRAVGLEDLEISWTPVKGVAGYVMEIDQPELGINITMQVPASITKFTAPDAVLRAGTKYTLAIGTVDATGNRTFIETSFTTRGAAAK